MRILAGLILGLGVVGCGNSAEKKVIGEYERTFSRNPVPSIMRKDEDGPPPLHQPGDTAKWAFLDNGIVEIYSQGKKDAEGKWSVVDREIHVKSAMGLIIVWRINKDNSITWIATTDEGGKRTDSTWSQTYKKIK